MLISKRSKLDYLVQVYTLYPVLIHTWRWTMFDNLDDQMKKDSKAESTNSERAFVWLAVAVISLLAFGAVYYSIHPLA